MILWLVYAWIAAAVVTVIWSTVVTIRAERSLHHSYRRMRELSREFKRIHDEHSKWMTEFEKSLRKS